jgi:hypothetical protein
MRNDSSRIFGVATALAALLAACSHRQTAAPNSGATCACAARQGSANPNALHVAAEQHDLAQLRHLLESGTWDVNGRNAAGLTPLQAAFVSLGRVLGHSANPEMAEVVRYLLAKGANPNLTFSLNEATDYTPLHYAAFDGNMVLVPMLVEAHANPNARDSRGFTPLHSAARCDFRLSCDDCSRPTSSDFSVRWKQGAKPVIEYLLAHGADLRAKTVAGQSVLDIFATPCASEPAQCEPAALASGNAWPSGMCKQAYAFVRARMGE